MESSSGSSSKPGPLIAPVVLQYEELKNVVKHTVSRRGCHKPFKTQRFKRVLCLKVSGQGKLEFESARLRGRQSVRLSGRLSDGLRG